MDFDKPKVYGDTSITDGLVNEIHGIVENLPNDIDTTYRMDAMLVSKTTPTWTVRHHSSRLEFVKKSRT